MRANAADAHRRDGVRARGRSPTCPAVAGVRLSTVTKRFGDVTAVDNVDARHRRPRVPGAARPVGLRQVHAAADDRRAGGAHRGRDLDRRAAASTTSLPSDRDIAMVFQSYALYPHKTVQANIEFPLKARGVGPPERGRAGHARRPSCSASPSCSTASPASCPAASASGSRWPGPSCGDPAVFLHGRAAVEPRRQAARRDPGRADRPPPAARGARSSTSPTTRSRP